MLKIAKILNFIFEINYKIIFLHGLLIISNFIFFEGEKVIKYMFINKS